jgi:hypothetical protein
VTERGLTRNAARRLASIRHAQEIRGNVALTCRYYCVTGQCYYVWLLGYEELGVAGLRDRSSRPHLGPKATVERRTPDRRRRSVTPGWFRRRCTVSPHEHQVGTWAGMRPKRVVVRSAQRRAGAPAGVSWRRRTPAASERRSQTRTATR